MVGETCEHITMTIWLRRLAVLLLGLPGALALVAEASMPSPARIPFHASWFEDASNAIAPREVLNAPGDFPFRDVGRQSGFGVRRSTLWFRIDIAPQPMPRAALLEVGFPVLDQLDVFTRAGDGWRETRLGDTRPFSSRPIRHPDLLVPVHLAPGVPQSVFLRVRSNGPVNVPLALWDAARFDARDRDNALVTGVYFGILLALIVFNGFIYTSVRDPAYLYYVGYLGFITLFIFATQGLLSQYVLPNAPKIANLAPFVFLYLAMVIGLRFTVVINNTTAFSPRLARVIRFTRGLLLVVLASTVTLNMRLLTMLTPWMGFVVLGLSLHSIVIAIRAGYKPSYFVAIAFFAIMLGGVPYALSALEIIDGDAWPRNGFKIGVVAEALLLSFALAYRIRYMRRKLKDISEKAAAERAGFSAKLIEAQDRERREIATELHDGLGQSLLVINNRLGRLLAPGENRPDLDNARDAQRMVQTTIDDVRSLAHHLHPHVLDRLGLREAIIAIIRDAFDGHDAAVHYEIDDIDLSDDKVKALHLYRIVQEGVKNILTHASPERVEITLRQTADALILRIEDFAAQPASTWADSLDFSRSFGLSSIRERVELLMGKTVFSHNESGGFRVEVTIPFSP